MLGTLTCSLAFLNQRRPINSYSNCNNNKGITASQFYVTRRRLQFRFMFVEAHYMCQSATTLTLLTNEVDVRIKMQHAAGKRWVLAFKWMWLTHITHLNIPLQPVGPPPMVRPLNSSDPNRMKNSLVEMAPFPTLPVSKDPLQMSCDRYLRGPLSLSSQVRAVLMARQTQYHFEQMV